MFQIIFTFANSFECSSDRNVFPPGLRAEMPESTAPGSLQKIIAIFCEVAGHV